MATTTTNFGWDIPQSTDLVKDGATAIAALGQDIDTAMVDLKGGTTGQVLAKASGTDLDFSWVAQDDSNAIQNAIVDAKGDLIGATAADTPARLAVGTNGQVLTADSTAATGLAWANAAAGTLTLASIASGSLSGTSFTVSSLTQDTIRIRLIAQNNGSNHRNYLRLNSSSSAVYEYEVGNTRDNYFNTTSGTEFYLSNLLSKAGNTGNCMDITLTSCKETGFTLIEWRGYQNESGTSGNEIILGAGIFKTAAQITSFTVTNAAAAWTGGTYTVFGG